MSTKVATLSLFWRDFEQGRDPDLIQGGFEQGRDPGNIPGGRRTDYQNGKSLAFQNSLSSPLSITKNRPFWSKLCVAGFGDLSLIRVATLIRRGRLVLAAAVCSGLLPWRLNKSSEQGRYPDLVWENGPSNRRFRTKVAALAIGGRGPNNIPGGH